MCDAGCMSYALVYWDIGSQRPLGDKWLGRSSLGSQPRGTNALTNPKQTNKQTNH